MCKAFFTNHLSYLRSDQVLSEVNAYMSMAIAMIKADTRDAGNALE